MVARIPDAQGDLFVVMLESIAIPVAVFEVEDDAYLYAQQNEDLTVHSAVYRPNEKEASPCVTSA